MRKMPLFFKPVFYQLDNDSILFHYDELLELFRIPQFIIRKEIKSDKDLEKEMENISDTIKECGIISFGQPYAETSIKILDGLERIFFFSVETEPITRMPENFFWLKYDDVIKENDEIAWWDQNAILTYIPNPKRSN